MAFMECRINSQILGAHTAINVIIPQTPGPHPVMYLLHGLSDDESAWVRNTSIERYAVQKNMAVIMPDVNRSFYTDMVQGAKYWTYVSQELPEIVQNLFHVSQKREDTFVAGLSMGGYGAFKLALNQPERFFAAASLSGALDMESHLGENWNSMEEFLRIFGKREDFKGSINDLFHVSESLKKSGASIPKLYQYCGTEDFLYSGNKNFLSHAKALGLDLTYTEGPGDHSWLYWDQQIAKVLEWIDSFGKR